MNRMKLIGLIIVIVLVGWFVAARRQTPTPVQEVGTSPTVVAPDTVVSIDSDTTKPVSATTYNYDGVAGKTALELLKAKYQNVATQSSSVGDFVTTIDGKKADSTKEYWAFYVNGSLASEGAGTYATKATDKIEWRLELL
ncbi:MAG: DUF4430 domain-containing protein [bacterium]|nr:DUF4430 domain-containing protein [bacterium]